MFGKIKEMLGLVKFLANSRLKDGTEIVVEGDLAEGVAVYVVTDEGNIPLPDGTYELEDNGDGSKMITVLDGMITAIEDVPVEEEEPVEEEAADEPESQDEEPTSDEISLDEKIATIEDRLSILEEKLSEVSATAEQSKQENDELKKMNEDLSSEKDLLSEKVSDFEAKLSKMDGADPVKKSKKEIAQLAISDSVSQRIKAIQNHMVKK